MKTDTPRTDACPHCGKEHNPYRSCVTKYSEIICDLLANYTAMTEKARKAEAEVERLTGKLHHAVYLLQSYNSTYSDLFAKEFK
jgi:hypothetical protein